MGAISYSQKCMAFEYDPFFSCDLICWTADELSHKRRLWVKVWSTHLSGEYYFTGSKKPKRFIIVCVFIL